MTEEKNRLKYIRSLIREKQRELSTALHYSKVLDMENRLAELKKEQPTFERKLEMLEGLKSRQENVIERENKKEEKSMEQVNSYKNQLRELNMTKKANEREIRTVKTDNDTMEKQIHVMRKHNEKLARAIKNVKMNPSQAEEINSLNRKGSTLLESQLKSDNLDKINQEIEEEQMKKDRLDLES
mmetsp:Transcript_36946/g.56580  ORF Transcript_36946/g.56580 Transcript_36946/m.56580 type:complete len:184 (+) Transcript_36946:713-1264(+)